MTQTAKATIVDSAEKAIEVFEKAECPHVVEFIKWLQKDEQKDLVHIGASIGLFEQLNIGGGKLSVNGEIVTVTPLESMIAFAQGVALNIDDTPNEALRLLDEIFEEMLEITRLIEKKEFLDLGDVF